MPRRPLRRLAVPLAATLAIIFGVVQVPFWGSVQAWGGSWGAAVAAIGLTILILWTLNALARLGAAAPTRPPFTRRSATNDAAGAFAGWLFQIVCGVLVLGAVVGGIAWVAARVYRLLP